MFVLPWKLWIDPADGNPTQRETDVLLGGQGDSIPIVQARALGLINADGTPHEPRRGKSTKADPQDERVPLGAEDEPEQEEPGDGE